MAIRIQLRHDTSANWELNNPTLREGEFGIETDTLKIKVGPVPVTGDATAWSSITNYVNLVPSDFNNIINGYVEANDIGASGGVVGLNNDKNAIIPGSSIIIEGPTNDSYETTLTVTDPTADRTITLPNATGTVALTTDITAAVDAITTDVIEEGSTNKYFTDDRAQDAVATALAAGTHTNISVSYNDSAGSISLTGAVTYTDENAQDAIGNAVGTGLSYNDSTGAISVDTSTIQARVTDVSDTEIGYLNGVTSAIQTQLDDKSTASKTETLTNKTLTTPTINGPTITATGQTPTIHGIYLPAPHNIIFEGTTADDFETTLQAGEPTADRTITLPDATGTVALVANVAALSGATFTGAVSGTDLTLSGNLTVNGTTTTLNSTTISVDDKNIELGSVETPSDATADGGGITLKGTTDKTFNWVDATDAWTSSEHLNLASGKSVYLNGTLLKDATETLTNKTINANANTITVTSANVSDFNEASQDAVGNAVGTGLTYTDSTGAISVDTTTIQARVADVSDTEIGYLNGVTSAIQTQLNGKTSYSAPTIGSTSIASGDTISQIDELTLFDPEILISTGTSGSSTVSGTSTQWSGTGNPLAVVANLSSVPIGATLTVSNGLTGESTVFTTTSVWSSGTINVTRVSGSTSIDAGFAEYPDMSSNVVASWTPTYNTISSVELKYLDGITSNVQTQLDSKIAKSLFDTKGDILVASADNTPAKLAAGTNGYLLTANSSATNGVEWAAAPVSLPSQSGESGKYLTTDGTTASWGTLVVPITTGTATITGNTATTIDTNALSGFTSIEYMVSLKQGSKIRTSKVIVQTDGTSVDMTEFAITETGGTIAGVVISAAVSSTNAVLQVTATDAATTNVTVKFSEIKL